MVNNAGITRDATMRTMTETDFDDVIRVHLKGTWNGTRMAAAIMRERKAGAIVNISSLSGKVGMIGQTNYSAAKAAVVGMVRTWALECAKAEITVNAVVPVAATAMTKTIPAFAPYVSALEERGAALPYWLRRGEGFGTAADAAGLVVFLASDAAAGITGQAIGIGGDRLSLWSHPSEVAIAYAESGWSADAIAATWATSLGRDPQTYGIPAPKAPAS
jgi:NAD(P)-dependent dehydrogenase (short-subunit alcohol dehydrogenase family)